MKSVDIENQAERLERIKEELICCVPLKSMQKPLRGLKMEQSKDNDLIMREDGVLEWNPEYISQLPDSVLTDMVNSALQYVLIMGMMSLPDFSDEKSIDTAMYLL